LSMVWVRRYLEVVGGTGKTFTTLRHEKSFPNIPAVLLRLKLKFIVPIFAAVEEILIYCKTARRLPVGRAGRIAEVTLQHLFTIEQS